LSGRQAFAGDTVSDLIARILEREPDWDALPSRTPQRIRDLLKRCLEKDAKQRLRDIGDARIEIDNVIATRTSSPDAVAAAAYKSRSKLRTIFGAISLVVMTAAATYYGVPRSGTTHATKPSRFEVAEMPGTHMDGDGVQSAVSPDGRMLVYGATDSAGVGHLWIRSFESLTAREVPGTDGTGQPFWSPDGRYIGFFKLGTNLMKVAVTGGTPETIASVKGPRGGTWNQDGVILYAPLSEGPIYRISANGGDGVAITTLDSTETAHRYPWFLPDGKHFLYSSLPPREGRYRIFMGSLDGKTKKLVLDTAGGGAVYAGPGYLLYDRDGVIVAQHFDAGSGRVSGEPVSLGDRMLGTGFSGAAGLSATTNGVISYCTNTPFTTHLVWATYDGKQIADVPMASGKYVAMTVSPDGRAAVLESSPRIGISDLWLADLERGVVTRLSYEEGENTNARWSFDGTRVAYTSAPMGGYEKIVVVSVNGGAQKTYLEKDRLFKQIDWDIWILPLDGDGKPRSYLQTPYFEDRGRLSPDGRWLVYRSDESGQYDMYVQSFPEGGNKYKVTTNGGNNAGFSGDGRRLYFSNAGDAATFYAADVLPDAQFRLGPAHPIAHIPADAFDSDLTRDGRLLLLTPARAVPPQSITIVQNWPALLEKK
jgi:Tol biopolymer transport system component